MSMQNANQKSNILSQIMNASGCNCRTKEQLDSLVSAGMQTIITKTCTLRPHSGNLPPVFIEVSPTLSVNCLGMPNLGYTYYRNLYPEYHAKGINYIISMDASHLDNLLEMLQDYDSYLGKLQKVEPPIRGSASAYVEINLSCPSTTCPRIIAYDILAFARVLESIKLLELVNIRIGLKLAPYVDKVLLQNIANLIMKYQESARIGYIVCANSIPNGMVINPDTGVPILSSKTGGISGVANKLLGIANVYQFNELFQKQGKRQSIQIIGCGGIETLRDVQDYLAAGADSVQIGRLLYTQGITAISSILENLDMQHEVKAKL